MTRFVAWIRKTLQLDLRLNETESPRERLVFPRVYESRLEDRRVLSATPVVPGIDLAVLTLDAGAQANDGQADRFEISRNVATGGSNQITISINQERVWQGESSQLSSIRLNGSADQDVFVIDPSIHIAQGVFIDGGGAPASSPDELVFANTSGQVFDQINYQAFDGRTQVQFIGLADSHRTEYHISSVDSIFDDSRANQRTLENHSSIQDWVIQSRDASGVAALAADQHVELSSGQGQYVFAPPSERLVFDTRFSNASTNNLVMHDLRLAGTSELLVLGDATDSVYQAGLLNVGSTLQFRSGSIQIAGAIQTTAANLVFDAQSSLQFTTSASILNEQGSVVGSGNAVWHSGVISVGTMGTVTLEAITPEAGPLGRITVNGDLLAVGNSQQQGGSISLLGAEIQLLSNALIDVSGGVGGGQILVGGNVPVLNFSLGITQSIQLASGAVMRADAQRVGDGGRIIVWANDATIVETAVSLSARGGVLAGDGGFIETSGKQYLNIQGTVDASAANGRAGNWLIDPTDVEIVAVLPDMPAADTSYILASDINAALAAGTNVIIETNAAGSANGDITVNSAISAAPAGQAQLTLIALRDVIFNQGVSSNGNLGVSIFANRNVEAGSVDFDQLNFLNINAGGAVNLQSIDTSNGSDNAGQAIDIQASTIFASGSIQSLAGDIRLQATSTATGNAIEIYEVNSFGGNIEINADSAVAFLGGASSVHSSGGNGSLTISGSSVATTIGLGTGAAGSLSLDDVSIAAIGPGFDNGIQFGAVGQVGNIVLNGAQHDYDQSITIKLDGGATLQLLTDLSTAKNAATGKSIQIDGSATSTIELSADLLTAGGDVVLVGGTLLVDGSAVRRIVTGGTSPSAGQGGAIDLGGLTAIDGVSGVAELELDSRGTLNGGAVSLAAVTATGSGLNRLDIQTSGTLDGQVTLSDMRLIHNATVAPQLRVNQADASPQTILASGVIDLSTNQVGLSGGSVDLGVNLLGPAQPGSSLTILTRNTDTTPGADGSQGGNITLGGIGAAGADYLDSVFIDTSAGDSADSSGRLILAGSSTASITVDGSSGGNPNLVGISLVGDIEVSLGGSLRLSTHPGVAVGFNSQAIDLRQAQLLTAVSLLLDTSGGGNLPTVAGNVFIGDMGTGVRPTGLVVDTRGGTQGRLIIDDGDAGISPTVVHVDGDLDLRHAIIELQDTTQLITHGNGQSLRLGRVLTSGGPQDLTLISDADIEVSSIDLSDGNLVAQVDANNDQAGSSWRSTGLVEVGTLTLNGSAAGNDLASIEGGLTTTLGAMQFTDWDQLRLLSDLTSAGTVTASNISGGLVLGDSADIVADGSIQLSTTVAGIVLQGANGTVNVIEAQGDSSVLNLTGVTATNSNVQLSLLSDYSVTLGAVDLQSGTLLVDFSSNTTQSDATATLDTVQAGQLHISGGSRVNDRVVLNGIVTVGSGGLLIEDINQLDIHANLTSAGDLKVNDVSDRVQVAQSVTVTSTGDLDIQTGVNEIRLSGAANTINRFEVVGNSGTLRMSSINSVDGVDLQLVSENSINLRAVNLAGDGDLSITLDSSNDTAGARLDATSLSSATINIVGSANLDDVAVISNAIESLSGSIVFDRFASIQWNGNVTSATNLQVSNVSNRLIVGPNTTVQSSNGHTTLTANVGAIEFVSGVGTNNSITARHGSLQLAALIETTGGGTIALRADGDVELQSSALASNLLIVAADNGGLVGQIRTVSTLAASSLNLTAATGIGGASDLLTATQNVVAVNRVSGDIRISNTSGTTVVASNVEAQQGGNVTFHQRGGGALHISRVVTIPDGSPTAAESSIFLENEQASIVVGGTGVDAGGEGSISYATIGTGDIILNSVTRAVGNSASLQSSGAISGNGAIIADTIVMAAATGIGNTLPIQTQAISITAASGLGAINLANTSATDTTIPLLATSVGGSIRYVQTGGGALTVHLVQTGANEVGGAANIGVYNHGGSMLLVGSMSAGGTGSVDLSAAGDLVLGSMSSLETQGVAATIHVVAGGQFQFTPGSAIRAGSSDPATAAVVTELPPQLLAQAVVNILGANVDLAGNAHVQVLLGAVTAPFVDRNFGLSIHWGDGQIDRLPGGPLAPNTTDPGIPRYDANGLFYQITHQYLVNPNPSDPYADIPVRVAISVDALGRIQVSDSSGSTNILAASQMLNLVVPSTGLFSLNFSLPQAATVQLPFVFNRVESRIETTTPVIAAKSLEQNSFSAEAAVKAERTYVLRVVTPVDETGRVRVSEDVPLEEADIADLQLLFKKLGDNRYRICLILEDGNELLLRDFYLRDHIPIEIDELELRDTEMQWESQPQGDEVLLEEN